MMEFKRDVHGIYVASKLRNDIFYPKNGTKECFSIEDTSFWFRYRNRVIWECIRAYPFQKNFIDIGGGNGYQIAHLKGCLPKRNFYFLEPSYEGCLNAKKRGVNNVYCGLMQDVPFSSLHIDGFGLFDVLEHIADDCRFLTILSKKITKGAIVYITVPALSFLWSGMDIYAKHFRRYSVFSLHSLAKSSGFKVLFSSYFFSFLTPIVLGTRVFPYRIGMHLSDAELLQSEKPYHNAPLWMQSIIQKMSNLELDAIKDRRTILFGTSCVCVLQKI